MQALAINTRTFRKLTELSTAITSLSHYRDNYHSMPTGVNLAALHIAEGIVVSLLVEVTKRISDTDSNTTSGEE